MANKRELKKFVRNTCGAIALDMILAYDAFPQIDRKNVHEVVLDAARLQTKTLRRMSVAFDRTPAQFDNTADYHKARKAFYAEAYTKLLADFDAEVELIVKKMNAALPDDVRAAIKEALA